MKIGFKRGIKTKRENWEQALYASFIAQALCILGISASFPFIPLFLMKDLNITDPAAAGLWAGVMGAISSLLMAVFAPIWGIVADRYGRKMMVLRAMIGGCLLIMLMSICNDVWLLLVLRILQGALVGTVSANMALITSVTPRHRVGYALGLMQTAIFAGSSIGPLIGGVLADVISYRFAFFITSLALGVAALIVFFFVHENFEPVEADAKHPKENWREQMGQLFGQKPFVAMALILVMVQFANTIIAPVLAIYIKTLNGTAEGASTLAGLELAVTGIASAFSAVIAGRLSDRYGHRKVLVISSLAAAFLYFPQAIVGNVWELLILRAMMGLFFGGIIPSANALIAEFIPEGRKGIAYGVVNGMGSLGFGIGPLTGAIVAASFGIHWVFILTGIALLMSAYWVNLALSKINSQRKSYGLLQPQQEPSD